MSRKSTIDALFGARTGDPLGAPNAAERAAPAVRTGAVAAMGASLQQWTAAQKTSEDLQAQLAGAKSVVELDPASIDPAPVRDRLSIEQDPSLDALVESIRSAGQHVPALVRPHPDLPGRFQTAYGHRRIEAARRLGRPVLAIISHLSDQELLTAQGKENAERRDLSFIERAVFARRLEDAKFDRALISTALATDKADLSRAIAVARALPDAIVQAIGPAPKAGRARWMLLAERVQGARERKRLDALLGSPEFLSQQTDQRFITVLNAVSAAAKTPVMKDQVVIDQAGKPVALRKQGKGAQVFEINEKLAPGFADFLAADLPNLFQRYVQERSAAVRSE